MLIPELGHFAFWLGFGLSLSLAVVPQVGSYAGWRSWMGSSIGLSYGVFLFASVAFGVLLYGFLTDDFSVAYIAKQSNTAMPWYFKASALWGGHEGSLMLWIWVLALWVALVALLSTHLPLILRARILSVLGMICVGFFALLGDLEPFERTLPNVPADGQDLNPLLQDVGLIFHRPCCMWVMLDLPWPLHSQWLHFRVVAWMRPGRAGRVLDNGGLGIPQPWYCTGLLVGLLRARLGRLVVLGSSRKRVAVALAGGHCAGALAGGDEKVATSVPGPCCWR